MLSLGLVGESPGNGHPYSWSAIVNGYEQKELDKCDFPAIPAYLRGKAVGIYSGLDARVTSIFTPDISKSRKIARATHIPFIATSLDQVLSESDAILLARDDVIQRRQVVHQVIRSGLPVLIDKPFELDHSEAKKVLESRLFDHQISTYSALRYAPELDPRVCIPPGNQYIRAISASVPKFWDTYSVHAIEPALRLLDKNRGDVVSHSRDVGEDVTRLTAVFSNSQELTIETRGREGGDFLFTIHTVDGTKTIKFTNTFDAFRTSLETFVQSVISRKKTIVESELLEIISLIERGRYA